ncbi:hypothetical protein HS088_TW07G00625 [Tripterygium wilfordii]|uniref:Uncharacterized protein n=1 Tax=Tripterygium wilfordii TaxID=458696 RepID=A0A7J7DFK0_TRIWF|nr:uncharacterized protein LOC120001828 [Tripterygium wilfordii]XP_038706237.1 uncharacterized protein LOC120001828 [Tripterygium wilfordii]KAF5745044.1 hypothetical protein HS088_TW07G00625 [Tripterygium wilfordii]
MRGPFTQYHVETGGERGEKQKMLPVKLVRSLVLGETIGHHPLLLSQNHCKDDDDRDATSETTKTPMLLFVPTRELVTDVYRLASIARDMGMDLYPTPSLSHVIFSYPSASSSSSPSSSSKASSSSSSSPYPSSYSWSSSSLSLSLLPKDAIPLSFPSISDSSLSHLRSFVSRSKGLFKLVFYTHNTDNDPKEPNVDHSNNNWDCSSLSLFSRLTGHKIDSMDGFCSALAGTGWTLFKTKKNPSPDPGESHICGGKMAYLFRKVDSCRIRGLQGNGECRMRELRLPKLDFRNAPLRILQYILLMTDDLFYLA